jgi:hemerythrin-like domain-containing protein
MAHPFLDILHDEHEEVRNLLGKLSSELNSMKEKDELFEELKKTLMPHMKGEEKFFYPRLLKDVDHAMLNAYEAIEEHSAVKTLLKELENMTFKDIRWDAKLHVLKELIDHHIKDEEGKVFNNVKKMLSDDELDDIQSSYEEVKSSAAGNTRAKTRPRGGLDE